MGETAPNEGTNDMTAIGNPTAAPRSPLDDLAPDLRVWLVDEMGMQVELGGGGCTYLRHEGPHGSYILVTCYGGGGMPSHDSWQVGAYRDADSDSVLDFASDQDAVTLRMAVGAACGVLADFAPVAKRWTLIVTRDTTESACVTVEADSEENARAEVMNMLNGAEWITDDGNMPKEPYVTDCQPADD